jgi:hypothetical protein
MKVKKSKREITGKIKIGIEVKIPDNIPKKQ